MGKKKTGDPWNYQSAHSCWRKDTDDWASGIILCFPFCLVMSGQPHLAPRGSIAQHSRGHRLLFQHSVLRYSVQSMYLNWIPIFPLPRDLEAGALSPLPAGMAEGSAFFPAQWKAQVSTRVYTTGRAPGVGVGGAGRWQDDFRQFFKHP